MALDPKIAKDFAYGSIYDKNSALNCTKQNINDIFVVNEHIFIEKLRIEREQLRTEREKIRIWNERIDEKLLVLEYERKKIKAERKLLKIERDEINRLNSKITNI